MTNVSKWSTTAGSNSTTSPDGFPENMAPSGLNNSSREMMAALAKNHNDQNGSLILGGSGGAYTLTTNNANASLSDSAIIIARANHNASASATLNIDSLGVKEVKKYHDIPAGSGDIEAGQLCMFIYNYTHDNYQLMNPSNRAGTFTTLDSTSFKAAANNFGAPANFTNTIGTQSAPDFLYNDSTKKLYCRSVIIAEQNDTSEIAIRRVNGTLTSPTAVLTGELSGILYWQPWIATDWGSGSPNYGRTGQIQSRLTEPTPTRTNTGGNVGIAVTKHGSDVLRERFWVNNDGDVVCAGQAGDAGHAGLESTTTSYPATHTIYSQDAGDHATCAWRHDDDISEGFDWDITQATNILTLLRVLSDARTSILTIDGSGINGVIGATTAAAGTFTAATIDNITIDGNTISCATGSNLEIVPFAGQNIRLDGAIVIDAGVVTGATSITSTGFTGALTGNVTGNVSGTAATVTGAAQAAITSLGTLTTLTVDNITINGAAISSDTGAISFSDEDITTTGQVNAANFSSSTNVISDDSVISFVTVSGAILKLGTGGSPANGRPNGFVRIEASETPYEIVLERTTNIAFATGVHTGTTGSDGNLTIAVNTTTCYIENRTGGAIGIDLTMFSR